MFLIVPDTSFWIKYCQTQLVRPVLVASDTISDIDSEGVMLVHDEEGGGGRELFCGRGVLEVVDRVMGIFVLLMIIFDE